MSCGTRSKRACTRSWSTTSKRSSGWRRLARERVREQRVLLRVAPGVEAHTHAHILTGALDTKFGVSIETGAARAAAEAIHSAEGLKLVGLHAHIGSQIFELGPYQATIRKIFDLAAELRDGIRVRAPRS